MKKLYLCLGFLFSCFLAFPQPEVALNAFGSGFSQPITIENAGDERLFIGERGGVIKILNDDGTTIGTPFLDIQNSVLLGSGAGDERGFLGMAFHPNYSSNGFFYVNYSNNSGNNVISRFSVSPGDPNLADPNSELILLTITQPFMNHNGGDITFGPDGYLYIAMGDGGSGGDPGNRAQSLNTLLGKLLRIDVDSGSPYGIPTDNPFFNDNDTQTLDEIWAYGLRNPWRISFDSQTGDLWVADVGQAVFEEINMVGSAEAGINYGWRCYEGNATFNTSGCPAMNTLTFPIGQYSHNNDGLFKCSITGGFRYRGSENPGLFGTYIFADYCSVEVGVLEYDGNNWNMFFSGPFTGTGGLVTFGEDMNNELYVAGLASGNIYKVVDANLSVASTEVFTFKMYPNPTSDELTFNFSNGLPSQIKFYDIQGKLIQSISEFYETTLKIPTQNLANGLYIVKVNGQNDTVIYKKLVVK